MRINDDDEDGDDEVQVSAVADGTALRVAFDASCCTRRWTLRVKMDNGVGRTWTVASTVNLPTTCNISISCCWLARATKSCCRQSLTISAINCSGRASELGGIVNLVDRRRSSLSRTLLELSRRSICRGEIFWVRSLEKKFQEEVPLFCGYMNFLKTLVEKKTQCQKPDYSVHQFRCNTDLWQADKDTSGP